MFLIYTDITTPRVAYTFKLVFGQILGIHYKITTEVLDLLRFSGPSMNYSKTRVGAGVFISRTDLLTSNDIVSIDVKPYKKKVQSYLFPAANDSDLHFDLFAASFYMVSRYEEYLPYEPDIHGRFKATASIAYKHNFLLQPIVNEWAAELKFLLLNKFPELEQTKRNFSCLLTYDIDVAFTFKGRGVLRTLLSTIKDLAHIRMDRLIEKLKVISGWAPDPSDVYSQIEIISKEHNLPVIFFFLVGDLSTYDRNLNYASKAMKNLLKNLQSIFTIGLHPSYSTTLDLNKIRKEKDRLEILTGNAITKSRQHFLRFSLPETFSCLIQAGITEDYSMGFADYPGFRAGICTPFYFYDLKHEEATNLLLYPSAYMDGNYIKYLKATPSEASIMITDLIQKVKAVDGLFTSIWHNDTLSGKGTHAHWKEVHDDMIKQVSSNTTALHE